MEKKALKILRACKERRVMGMAKYGARAYETRDMFKEMKEELYDLINYALFQIIKLEDLEAEAKGVAKKKTPEFQITKLKVK